MLKLPKIIKNQLLKLKKKRRFFSGFDWRLFLRKSFLPLCILFGFALLTLLIIWVRNLPAKAPNFKKNSESSIYTYEAKNKNFESGIGLKDQNPIVSFSVPSGQNITFIYQVNSETSPQLSSQDKNLTFTGIENDIDLKYQTLPIGIKEEIVLNQARQKEKDANVFIFDANFQGAFPKESIKGFASPVFYDENNEYLFHFEKPFAIDASGNRTDNVSLQIEDKASSKIPDVKRSINEESPYLIRLTVDQAWLNDPARVYPITIDPTIVHDTSSEFSAGSFNRAKDTGSGASPVLETYYQELATDDEAVSLSLSSVTLDYAANSIPAIPSLNSPADTATNQSSLPTLLTTTTDADGDYLRYKIQLCTNLAMTTSCQTFDQTSSQTGWSGQNADSSQAYTSGTQASYTLQTDLLANTTYYWRSYAIDPVGGNVWSSTQSTPHNFTTMNAPLPASACFIQESITDSQLQIIWTDNASNEDFYEVQRSVDGGAWTVWHTAIPANTINYIDNTISDGHTYQYRVAPYFTGPFYSTWCTTSSFNLGVGLFNLEGINASGLHFN